MVHVFLTEDFWCNVTEALIKNSNAENTGLTINDLIIQYLTHTEALNKVFIKETFSFVLLLIYVLITYLFFHFSRHPAVQSSQLTRYTTING